MAENKEPIKVPLKITNTTNQSIYQTNQTIWTSDIESILLQFTIEDKEPIDLIGWSYSIYLSQKNGMFVVREFDIESITEINQTVFNYKMYADELKNSGMVTGQIIIKKDGTALTSRQFTFMIQNGLDHNLNAPYQYVESLSMLNEQLFILREHTEENENKRIVNENERELSETQRSIDYKNKVDNAIVEADVVEKVDNKVAELAPRLTEVTAQLTQTAKINSQVNFVDFVQNNKQPYDYMKLLKRADNAYQIWLSNSDKGIIYDFVKDPNDDFVKLNAGFSGLNKNGYVFVDKDVVSDTDLTGNFMTSGVSRYTTTIGNTFTLKATGERLVLTINAETRGGLWSVTVDGNAPKMVSCYNPTTVEKDVVIAEGLSNVTHTVVGTFLGDDPNNPPSSSPSRGYIRGIDTPEKGTLTGYSGSVSNTTEKTLLATSSNKEFAFTVTKNGFQNWVPEHDAKGSAFQITPPEFYIDDQKIDIVNMTVGSTSAKTIEYNFEIKQHFYGHAVGYGPVMKIWTSHKIGLDGKLTFDGKMEAVENFEAVGYPMMLPAQNEFMNEFVSGIYNTKTNNGNEQYSYFTQENDAVNSGAIISNTNKNLIVAGTLLNPIKTYRLGEGGKPPLGESLFLWNRSSKPKMYWMSMQANNFVIGDTYRWGFEMAMAEIDNVYDMIKY